MSNNVELLRFVALSAAVHADAVQCLADDTRRVLSQMAVDGDQLEALEAQLTDLLQKQRRLHTLRDAVTKARQERSEESGSGCKSSGSRAPKSTAPVIPPTSAGNVDRNIKCILQFASRAVEKDEIQPIGTRRSKRVTVTPTSFLPKIPHEERTETTCDSTDGGREEKEDTECTIDEEVERLKMEIRHAEAMSVEKKLRDLEALKQQVKEVDANSLVQRYVGSFSFPMEVEELWRGNNVLNCTNIDTFVSGACKRFAWRYDDALRAISDFPLSEASDAARVYGSTLYAEELTSSSNYDAVGVQVLERSGESTLPQFYRRKRRLARVSAPFRRRAVGTVLGPEEFTFLPTDWPATQLILPPAEGHLPPAKHIMTPRFSFASTDELKALQSLRVDIQRSAVAAFMDASKALDELMNPTTLQRDGIDYKATLIRLLEAERKGSSRVWTTLAREG